MSIDDSEPFLLNLLKNPKILSAVYDYIRSGETPKTVDEISAETSLSQKVLVEETVPALGILNMIQKINDKYRVFIPKFLDEAKWKISDRNLNSLIILNRLAEKARSNQGWGKQAVYFLTYRFLVEKKYRIFSSTDNLLVENLNTWFAEKGYSPRSSMDSQILMNKQKLENFAKLTDFCGITSQLANGNYLISIKPDLFFDLIKVYSRKKAAPYSISEFIRWLDMSFLPTYEGVMNNSDVIPPPYSDVIATLHDKNNIELVTWGDFTRYKIYEPKLPKTPITFNALRCQD